MKLYLLALHAIWVLFFLSEPICWVIWMIVGSADPDGLSQRMFVFYRFVPWLFCSLPAGPLTVFFYGVIFATPFTQDTLREWWMFAMLPLLGIATQVTLWSLFPLR